MLICAVLVDGIVVFNIAHIDLMLLVLLLSLQLLMVVSLLLSCVCACVAVRACVCVCGRARRRVKPSLSMHAHRPDATARRDFEACGQGLCAWLFARVLDCLAVRSVGGLLVWLIV